MPDFQSMMAPLLEELASGATLSTGELRAVLAARFALSAEDLGERLPSGRQATFDNRVGWATTYLKHTGLLERPARGRYRITERGRKVLAEHPAGINLKVLSQFPEFHEFRAAKGGPRPAAPLPIPGSVDEGSTPEERIASAYGERRAAVAATLLERIYEQTPDFFERLVLDVLLSMGYGGSGSAGTDLLGRSGDGGVDGVIREDELGLDLIYVQAKRWQDGNVVGRPEIQKFYGALHGQRATKGIFITTSAYSKEAQGFADNATPRVILVDGQQLAGLMIDHGVGVTVTQTYELHRIDLDYFAEEDDGGSG